MSRFTRTLFLFTFLNLGGCSYGSPEWNSEAPYSPSRAPEIGDILHTATGHYINRQELFASLVRYPLVYVGEQHDNPASHRLQLDVLKAMQARHPGQVALGMEMFNSEQQAALEQWVAGELSEKEFLQISRWYQNWGTDFDLYRELLEFSRDQNIPVIGLNVADELGRKISMTPPAQLDDETRQKLPEMDMNDPYHQAMIEAVFSAHAKGSPLMESFSRRQTLWDETMAASVADYMRDRPDHHMVVVAGGWHVSYGFGIPRRVHRRLPLPYVLVGGENLVVPDEKLDQLMNVQIPHFPMRELDYVVFQEYEIFKSSGVQLGVMFEEHESQAGLLVTGLVVDSVAAKSGIQQGDRLLRFDDKTIEESFDLIHAVKSMRPGNSAIIELKRGDETLAVEVQF